MTLSRREKVASWDRESLHRLHGLRALDTRHHLGIDCVRLARFGWTAEDLMGVANKQGFRVVTDIIAPWACHSPDLPRADLLGAVDLLIEQHPYYQGIEVVGRVAQALRDWAGSVPVLLIYPALAAGLSLDELLDALAGQEPPTRASLLMLAALSGRSPHVDDTPAAGLMAYEQANALMTAPSPSPTPAPGSSPRPSWSRRPARTNTTYR